MVQSNVSPLVLPAGLQAERERKGRLAAPKPPEIIVRKAWSYDEAIDGMEMAPGTVCIREYHGSFMSAGGLELAQMDPETKGTASNVWYAIVMKCGEATIRDGTPVDYKNYPLPIGTLIEHTCLLPFKGKDGLSTIRAVEILRTWDAEKAKSGKLPPWWPGFEEER